MTQSLKKMGKQTVVFTQPPSITGYACVAGKKEEEGPLKRTFDMTYTDTTCGEKSWEKAESRMVSDVFSRAVAKANIPVESVDAVYAGDLLNQCIGVTFGLREYGIPFYGLYGACSTMAESLSLAAMSVDGGYCETAAALTSSHFCSAERQYRTPLEYGGQRTPTAQWTVTGAGAAIVGGNGTGPYITHATRGKIVDAGIKDITHMGAAMAPAAYETISAFFADTGMRPDDLDLIVTGDLGKVGREITASLFLKDGIKLGRRYNDCGVMIYDLDEQNEVAAGGSGCACSAVVLCGHILNEMAAGNWNNVLFCGTGALMSPTSAMQGESVPGICHAVRISNYK